MDTIKFLNFDCVSLKNAALSMLVTQSVGPRIISLRFKGGDNLFAELPDLVAERPDGKLFHFYGGHRLWHAPENMPRTYALDDTPVEIIPTQDSLSVIQQVEAQTGIEKTMRVSLVGNKPQVIVRHTLTNRGLWPVECAPWAITQLKSGGVAILPQSREQTEYLPNRSLALWPYNDMASPHVTWGNRFILIHAQIQTAFKVGFPNPRGWLAYWLGGALFVKRAAFDEQADYYDFGSSSECYCNDRFLELETLAPINTLAPGESATHTETWELYADVDFPADEDAVQGIIEKLGLE
jgi:hypothetical protein